MNDLSPDARAERQRAWTRYWQSGALHSCPTSFDGNYDGQIGAFWSRARDCLGEGARALDLATGNGAVPMLLAAGAAPGVVIDAVDAASVAPAWRPVPGEAEVRFHGGVWMERLPFEAGTFDLVSSQFGIEYAPRPDAWLEALRVLAPGASLHAVVHHRHSVFARVAIREAGHLEWLLAARGLLDTAVELSRWLQAMRASRGQLAPDDMERANAVRNRFNRIQAELEERVAASAGADALVEARAHVHSVLARAPDPGPALGGYRSMLEESRLRSRELVDCAMDREAIEALVARLRDPYPGLDLQLEELDHANGLMAWGMVITPVRRSGG